MHTKSTFAAFQGTNLLCRGPLRRVLAAIKSMPEDASGQPVAVLSEDRGREVDFDLRGNLDEVLQRIDLSTPKRRVGRPRMGVISREVTLLPRHWAWLDMQDRGAAATLRRLVDSAMKHQDAERQPQIDAVFRLMSAIAGNLPMFEEAARALYGRNWSGFEAIVRKWPGTIGDYLIERLSVVRDAADDQHTDESREGKGS